MHGVPCLCGGEEIWLSDFYSAVGKHIREGYYKPLVKVCSPHLSSTSCFTALTISTHFYPKPYLGSLTRYEKYYKTTFVRHKKLDNIVKEKNENNEE